MHLSIGACGGQRPWILEAGVTGGCESPDVGAGN